jgi:hypothetical protein
MALSEMRTSTKEPPGGAGAETAPRRQEQIRASFPKTHEEAVRDECFYLRNLRNLWILL